MSRTSLPFFEENSEPLTTRIATCLHKIGLAMKQQAWQQADTSKAEYDQAWLDYQHEVGLRHHRVKKNKTDGAASTALVPFSLIFPVTHTLKPFLSATRAPRSHRGAGRRRAVLGSAAKRRAPRRGGWGPRVAPNETNSPTKKRLATVGGKPSERDAG